MYNVIHGTDLGSTGYPYRIDGFDIIGKTGTSQIYDQASGPPGYHRMGTGQRLPWRYIHYQANRA